MTHTDSDKRLRGQGMILEFEDKTIRQFSKSMHYFLDEMVKAEMLVKKIEGDMSINGKRADVIDMLEAPARHEAMAREQFEEMIKRAYQIAGEMEKPKV